MTYVDLSLTYLDQSSINFDSLHPDYFIMRCDLNLPLTYLNLTYIDLSSITTPHGHRWCGIMICDLDLPLTYVDQTLTYLDLPSINAGSLHFMTTVDVLFWDVILTMLACLWPMLNCPWPVFYQCWESPPPAHCWCIIMRCNLDLPVTYLDLTYLGSSSICS